MARKKKVKESNQKFGDLHRDIESSMRKAGYKTRRFTNGDKTHGSFEILGNRMGD